jgi:Aspartyl protease
MKVDSAPQQTLVFTSISFGSHAKQDFTPDTGASTSAVDVSVAKQARLAPTHVRAKENTACSVVTAPKVVSGPWSLAGHALRPQSLVAARLLTSGPVAGLLGSDQMSRFGSVVFDYRGGRLVLGAG